MTRSELINRISNRFPQLLPQDSETAVGEIIGAIQSALMRGERVEIRGFGSFFLSYRPPRSARNPKSGETVAVAGRWTPHFRPGKALREQVGACTTGDEAEAP